MEPFLRHCLVTGAGAAQKVLAARGQVGPAISPAASRSPQRLSWAPLHTGEGFHSSDHFCGPPLDLLQQVHVLLVLRTPELDAALQDTVGFLGCECTLSAHVQFFIHQYPQVLLGRAALNPFIPQPVLILGVAPTQVQDPALGLVEPHEVHTGPLLELVQVPLDGILSLRCANRTTQLGVICKFAEEVDPLHLYAGRFIFNDPLGNLLILRLKKPHLQAPGTSVAL
ncbi:hypothetical protein QYF61_027206 [Mycteria americana]|uniref:Uncharacterized protein n=1 Tax=Mycteria americana TaxID=33587 RepID=A0AAN7NDA2_MYCAM|nr:hypothetical protein QYF61_027206 [Mycteria americana]